MIVELGPEHTTTKKHHNNNVWFDLECRKSKRKTNKLAKKHYKIPNQENRDNYFTQRKTYRALLKRKKRKFFATLNRNINQERNINWESFKKLKSFNKRSDDMDLEDLATFFSFLKISTQKKLFQAILSKTWKQHITCLEQHRNPSRFSRRY